MTQGLSEPNQNTKVLLQQEPLKYYGYGTELLLSSNLWVTGVFRVGVDLEYDYGTDAYCKKYAYNAVLSFLQGQLNHKELWYTRLCLSCEAWLQWVFNRLVKILLATRLLFNRMIKFLCEYIFYIAWLACQG